MPYAAVSIGKLLANVLQIDGWDLWKELDGGQFQ